MTGFRTSRAQRDDEAAVLPMINIVFLLLAFFLIAGQLRALPPFEVEPPALAAEPATAGADRVIHIGRDGALALDARRLSVDDIVARLGTRDGTTEAAGVRIIADRDVAARRVISLLERLREAGVEATELVTRRP